MKFYGLNDVDVINSRDNYGSNVIPDSEPTTFWEEFKETFKDKLILVLVGIAALMTVMFFLGYAEIFEPVGTIVAILIVAVVSAKTGVASDTKYRQLKDSTEKDKCKVYRNGKMVVINADDVVVGDKVLLQSGDKVVADGLLIDGNLKVDNSALNGEAEDCKKTAVIMHYSPELEDASKEDAIDRNLLHTGDARKVTGDTFVDAHSMFRGSVVTDGEGVLLVRDVGLKTMMGKMAEEMQEDEPDSPLKVKLAKLADQISKFGIIGAIVIALVYMVHTVLVFDGGTSAYFAQSVPYILMDLVDAISLAVVIIVCAVPEGLPLMIAIVLMQNTGKMLEHNVLVRKAEGIETAGSLNILFSDKTGTITKGHLEVVDFFTADGKSISLNDLHNHREVYEQVELAIGMNSQAQWNSDGQVIGGNMTDQALMRFLGRSSYEQVRADGYNTIQQQQGFNSTNKFSQVQLAFGKVFYKGAPERLLDYATKYIDADGVIQDIDKPTLNAKIDELANKAMRVLAFGYSLQKMTENEINKDVVIIGLVGIRDDVRPEAKEAIKEVQDAGIQVVMITGDRLETAVAIAKDAGLIAGTEDIALTSKELSDMSDDAVKKLIPNIRVIARALPTDKSRMVRLCQEMNLVVGMTGDGVNDSPALKRADVGFAMGSGTEAAKEAGKIVILDDNFKSIKDAILYGRTIYHNILKFCKFQLAINVTAVVVSAIAPFFGIDEPLKVTHLLFVNLVMDSLGALMLGNEPALESYMKENPRRRDESILSGDMLHSIGFTSLCMVMLSFMYLKLPTFQNIMGSEEAHLTGYFVLFITMALFNGFNVRSDNGDILDNIEENPNFLKIMFSIMTVQYVIVNAAKIPLQVCEWVGNMFSCVPIPMNCYGALMLFAALIIILEQMRKLMR